MIISAYNLSKKIISLRSTIFYLALKNAKSRYAGTIGGIFWTILTPLATILVYWFIFGIGLKLQAEQNLPFIILFLSGFIPWLFFSEALNINAQAITANPYLAKKTIFPTEILPISNLLTGAIPHLLLLMVLMIILKINGLALSINIFLFLYYFSGLCVLSLGLGWTVAALNVFYRDIGQSLSILLNIWFWLTPITWFMPILPEKWRWFIHLNPLYWVIEGYRHAFIPTYTSDLPALPHTYFWIVSISLLVFGAFTFKTLKFEFAEAL